MLGFRRWRWTSYRRPGECLSESCWRRTMADILVVDDDDVIRDTLCELLSTEYSCQTANTAEEALAKLEAQGFDVVLTDISMPGLNGKELLQKGDRKSTRLNSSHTDISR